MSSSVICQPWQVARFVTELTIFVPLPMCLFYTIKHGHALKRFCRKQHVSLPCLEIRLNRDVEILFFDVDALVPSVVDQDVRIGTSKEAWLRPMMEQNVRDGCHVPDPCLSSPCPQHSSCVDTWEEYECRCDAGKCTIPNISFPAYEQ